jgi:hypothetical protein
MQPLNGGRKNLPDLAKIGVRNPPQRLSSQVRSPKLRSGSLFMREVTSPPKIDRTLVAPGRDPDGISLQYSAMHRLKPMAR